MGKQNYSTMVKLRIYDSGKRPALPRDPKGTAHWIIRSMVHADGDKAHMGTYARGKEYDTEWTGSWWHINSRPFEEYIRYSLAKVKSFNKPRDGEDELPTLRLDIDLPTGIEEDYAKKGGRSVEIASVRIASMLNMIRERDIELNLILAEELLPNGFVGQIDWWYQELQQ